jgi:hypothetical protein
MNDYADLELMTVQRSPLLRINNALYRSTRLDIAKALSCHYLHSTLLLLLLLLLLILLLLSLSG